METNNSSRKPPQKEDRDEIIGRALSRTMKESAKAGECPSLEDISAFIDGKLDEKRRDELLGHLSHCDKCYEIFSTTYEAVKEEELSDLGHAVQCYVHEFDAEEVYATTKKAAISPIRKWAPIAIAAAAVLIILFKFVIQPFIGYVPPSSDQIFNMLAKNTDAKTLAASIKEDRITSFAFTGVMPLEKASFRIGACLTDLEVSLRAEDKTKSINLIKRIISTLAPMEGSEDIVSFYGNMSGKIAEGISPKEFSGKSQKVESFFKDKNVFLYLRFGEWVEGGRVAAFVKNREFFGVRSAQYFIDNLQEKDLPQGVSTSLNEIKVIFSNKDVTEKDFKQLEIAFTNILEMM
jgi:hypothetical protein